MERAQPLLRRRECGGDPLRGCTSRRRPAPRRSRHRRVIVDFKVRPADPSDAEALTRLAEAVSAEPEGWLISSNGEWRSVGDERRYLKALRRYPNAAVFVAQQGDGAVIGRLS